ncbi:hypothetical protein [Allorhodopirellula solitaria]|uniref:Uncharacterized protein n=1 Tax=Allorhodopirellula solitaria TaxID=2527987 RepID=A0A5C5YJ98_9BACT|nr:hypothetical protein [Allorhodopirellula solitaria]TWT74941.1 hypothetical protein CA85_02290 [Allorhodopirellula solitaria]
MNDPSPTTHPDPLAGDTGDRFVRRVQRASRRVLGGSEAGREITELCRAHEDAAAAVLADRADNATVIAIVGATGQGKSWITRQLVHEPSIAAAIRSGNQLDDATEKLTWIGPRPPSDLDSRHERFLACEAAKMQSIGTPYLIVDAPGATDDRRAIAGVAERALSLASVLLLVVRRDQLRSQRVTGLASASEGTIVIPVVNMVGQDEPAPVQNKVGGLASHDDLSADVETLVSRLRSIAPQSHIAPAVRVPDFEIDPRGEMEIGGEAAERIAAAVKAALLESGSGDHRRHTRLAALDARFTAAVASVLTTELPELTAAVDRLDAEARKLPTQIAGTLLGGDTPLRAAIRSRLRLTLLADTAAIWFPYRTVLSVLNLTHGAWDRVLLTFSGSIPSLVGAVYTSVQNVRGGQETAHDLRNGLRQRAAAAVTDRLGPMADRFRHQLRGLDVTPESIADPTSPDDQPLAMLAGIDALQEGSQTAFDDSIDRGSVSSGFALLGGLVGTLIFWALMAGPLVALYRGYLDASYLAIGTPGEPAHVHHWLDQFPHPSAAMLLTSLFLSLLPMAIFSMIILSVCQSRRRVDRIAKSLRDQHDTMIEKLQREGVLRLRWSDPVLADAEFLLSIGRSVKPSRTSQASTSGEAEETL